MGRRLRILSFALLIAVGMALALPAIAVTKTVKLTADNKFSPGNVSVAVGDTIEFKWEGGFHDVAFSDGTKSGAPTGDTGLLYSRTFDKAGTFSYVCTVHEASGMKGTITVAAASGGGSTSSTAAAGGSTATTTAQRSMPSTGPDTSPLPVLGGALVLIGTAGFVVLRRMET